MNATSIHFRLDPHVYEIRYMQVCRKFQKYPNPETPGTKHFWPVSLRLEEAMHDYVCSLSKSANPLVGSCTGSLIGQWT